MQSTVYYNRFLWVIFCLVAFTSSGQTADSLRQKFLSYSERAVQEKLYLHLDRSFYLVGESVWFKAYDVNAASNRLMGLSKIAYLEVLDREQNAVVQSKFSLLDGKGNGSVILPSSLASGNYKVRCYTSWMKNFSSDYFFEATITVVNPFVKFDPHPDQKQDLTYDIQFFPEGGQLVDGIESKVGFRAIDKDGKGIAFSGALVGENNDTLVRFSPAKFGIGNFKFRPDAAKAYRITVKSGNGPVSTFTLPAIQQQGYAMSVTDSTAELIKISVSTRLTTPESSITFLSQTRQENVVTLMKPLVNGQTSFVLAKDKLGEGITQMTIFNSAGKPVCERLYFKRPAKKLTIDGKLSRQEYPTRNNVVMDLSASGASGMTANLSMAVFLVDSINSESHQDINSYLLLSSDLKGTVESPDYYFSQESSQNELDNLMLTHGWRRFKWEDVLAKKTVQFPHLPEFDGHLIYGKVINTLTGEPAAGIGAYLAAPDAPARLFYSRSDDAGMVRFEVKDFFGPKEITVQTNLRVDSTYRFEMANPFSKQPVETGLKPFSFDEKWEGPLLTRTINMQTNNAFLPKWYRDIKYTAPDSLAFFGKPDEKYLLDDYTRFPTMEEVMREYVRGVIVRKRQKTFQFRMVDKYFPQVLFNSEPLILLDGIPVFNTEKIMAFDPLKVKKVELMNAHYYLGWAEFFGIVSLSTYRSDLASFEMDPRVLVLPYDGPQIQKEFYAPKYDSQAALQSRIPDFRNLLYWAPEINTDRDGKAQVNFYTSDQPGLYRVVVQGLSTDGQAGSKTFTFQVAKTSL